MEMNGLNNVNLPGADQYLEKLKDAGIIQSDILVNYKENEDFSRNQKGKSIITAAEEAVKQLNEIMKNMSKDLRFHLFVDGTDLAYVEVIDPKTNKVIRQVPPEQLIEALLRIHNAIGLILDKYI